MTETMDEMEMRLRLELQAVQWKTKKAFRESKENNGFVRKSKYAKNDNCHVIVTRRKSV